MKCTDTVTNAEPLEIGVRARPACSIKEDEIDETF